MCFNSGKGNKQVLNNNDEIGLAMKKNKGKLVSDFDHHACHPALCILIITISQSSKISSAG